MVGVWKKLNLKDQSEIVVMNAPESFAAELDCLDGVRVVTSCGKAKELRFLLAFVTRRSEIQRISKQIADKSAGDTVVWFAYPKQTSKKYQCEFNRDWGWEPLGKAGFEGVRQVAIDEDWSALRFRRVEFIKTMRRDPRRAQSARGKARTKRTKRRST